jgi:5-oxoprolinase (ATP-hydrolysing) subunit A
VHHEAQAAAVVDAVRRYDASLPVLGLPGSAWLALAEEAGLRTVVEAFADRAYTPAGTLVSRREPGAVLHDVDVIADRCVRLATSGEVEAVDGSIVGVRAESICVHGDTAGAVAVAAAVRNALRAGRVAIAPFVGAAAP